MAAVDERGERQAKARSGGRSGSRGTSNRRSATTSDSRTGTRGAHRRRGAPSQSSRQVRVRRFDADRLDRELDLETALAAGPTARQLLWIDVTGSIEAAELAAIVERLELGGESAEALSAEMDRPRVAVHGSSFNLTVATPSDGSAGRAWLGIIAGARVVITRHAEPIRLLDDIDERIQRDTALGSVEGAEFVAIVLDAVITSYFEAVDDIEDEIDDLDTRSLGDGGGRDLLTDLVALRRRIAALRRTMVAHRAVYAALTGPDMRQVVDDEGAIEGLGAASARYEVAIAAVEGSRDALIGSFDVYMSRTAQRTNDVIKALTIATVLLLPGSLIAGLLGMNVLVPLDKDDPASFWVVIAGVAALAVVVLVLARRRRWL